MKPKNLRIAGVIFSLALLWQAWQFWQVRKSFGIALGVFAACAYLVMEWLARKEEDKDKALKTEHPDKRIPVVQSQTENTGLEIKFK